METLQILPYTCVYIDCEYKDFLRAGRDCLYHKNDDHKLYQALQQMWTREHNMNFVIPCLSVRTALDLFLTTQQYPPGSEVIMSAVNIPDMVRVIHHHKLKVVPLDINLETMAPKLDLLQDLISDRTKVILLAHIYNKQFDVNPYVDIAQKYGIAIIEDCAESFNGFDYIGNPRCDLSVYSFGAIKYYTSFGGAIAKVRDPGVYKSMSDLNNSLPVQSHTEYLKKVIKYSVIYLVLNCPQIIHPGMYMCRKLNFDHKKFVVNSLRGFPDQMMEKLRHRPCTALLGTMCRRLSQFKKGEMSLITAKCDYVTQRLGAGITLVGDKALINGYWLFPIIVDSPDEVLNLLNVMGIDAYRGATQLNIVEPDNGNNHLKNIDTFRTRYPHEAKYLMDHVVYLPVNKLVPFETLDKIIDGVNLAVKISSDKGCHNVDRLPIKLQSKL